MCFDVLGSKKISKWHLIKKCPLSKECRNIRFFLQDFGVNCGQTGPLYHGLTEDEKNMVVFMHNTYRSKVARGLETKGHPGPQKTASDMLELTWDNELELLAQR